MPGAVEAREHHGDRPDRIAKVSQTRLWMLARKDKEGSERDVELRDGKLTTWGLGTWPLPRIRRFPSLRRVQLTLEYLHLLLATINRCQRIDGSFGVGCSRRLQDDPTTGSGEVMYEGKTLRQQERNDPHACFSQMFLSVRLLKCGINYGFYPIITHLFSCASSSFMTATSTSPIFIALLYVYANYRGQVPFVMGPTAGHGVSGV